eukprot:m.164560 g.164560  ORF g.164560 m.164560 type:complete len:90 (+) comp16583_c0_seq1:343-612(+)
MFCCVWVVGVGQSEHWLGIHLIVAATGRKCPIFDLNDDDGEQDQGALNIADFDPPTWSWPTSSAPLRNTIGPIAWVHANIAETEGVLAK